MEVYACGNCGGALGIEEGVKTVLCVYCGYTNDLRALSEEMEKFKSEVASWLANLGAVGGSGMDLGMRSVYFSESIYPSLLTEFSNIAGDTEDVLDFPLFYLRVYGMIPDLGVTTTWSPSDGRPMKEFSRKLESPDLQSFAPSGEANRSLNELRLRSLMMPMLMDVIALSSAPSEERFIQCSQTLEKLSKEAASLAKSNSTNEEVDAYGQYYNLLAKRFKISAEAYSNFAKAASESNLIDEEWFKSSTSVLGESRATLDGISGISVTDKVLLGSGIENDVNAITAGCDLINLYPSITSVAFGSYVEAVTKLASKSLFHMLADNGTDLSWFTFGIDSAKFSWFLNTLRKTIHREFYHIMAPKESVGTWISQQSGAKRFVLYPFYLSKIRTVLKSGFLLWKKGEEEEFYSLCDAAFNLFPGFSKGDYPKLMTPGFKKMLGSSQEQFIVSLSKAKGRKKPPDWVALPPTVSPADVKRIYSAAHNFLEEADLSKREGYAVSIPRSYKSKGFDPGKVKALSAEVIDVVFVPMALTSSGVKLMGNHLGLDENLTHRAKLAHAFDEFLAEISSS